MNNLGVDIGRVIIDGSSHPDGGDTAFFNGGREQLLRTPAMDGMFETLPELVDRFDGRAWLVSKCGPRVQQRSLQWLRHHDFFRRTGIGERNVRFCLQRPQKAQHCRELGISHFIDDKIDVHQALRGLVPHRFLFGPQSQLVPVDLTHTPDWASARAAVLATL